MGASLPDGRVIRHSLLTDYDVYLFKQGRHYGLYEKLGSHPIELNGETGTHFAVWAPNAERVFVAGGFNSWRSSHPLVRREDGSGVWEGFVPGVGAGELYKYRVVTRHGYPMEKGDPFAFMWETPPKSASVVADLGYSWGDASWMDGRKEHNSLRSPMSIYEVHLGSWRRKGSGAWLNYRESGDRLSEYLKQTGFTHAELMPVMEHPFYGSWGYQTVGYFAPTSRYGAPADFKYFVDRLHRAGKGVFLDWVPSHFTTDGHGLGYFDGTHLYEYSDPRKRYQPEWNSYIFDYGKNEVRSFLISNALFWLKEYHIDGLRVDAVASMIYLDYSRKPGEWAPNEYGGKENLEAISFLKALNEAAYGSCPDVQMIAEESTAYPMVSGPTYLGGLGFGMKWNMGWMHDTLNYFSKDPIHRKYHHDQLTFSIWYAFSENFVLSLSHDEVVYGKRSLLSKMPGDEWQKFANLRLLFGYMYGHPGKKLLFMGGEIGQWEEWYHERALDWNLAQNEPNRGLRSWIRDLNQTYAREPALHRLDFNRMGFQWVDWKDYSQSIISFLRLSEDPRETILVVCNLTPVPRTDYRVGVPEGGVWREILNSDAREYGGTGVGNLGSVESEPEPFHGKDNSISITLPPLGVLFLRREADEGP